MNEKLSPSKNSFRMNYLLLRNRLIDLLDYISGVPVTWVSGPAGSGKTTLVSQYLDSKKLSSVRYQFGPGDGDPATFFYNLTQTVQSHFPEKKPDLPLLTPEYLPAIEIFARRYFELLFKKLDKEMVLVFEDYHVLPDGSPVHQLCSIGFSGLPEENRVIVASRNDPPSPYARLLANRDLCIIDWTELRFTREETGELIKLHGIEIDDGGLLEAVYQKTEGWIAGLILLFVQKQNIGSGLQGAGPDLDSLFNEAERSSVFDYFACEVFNVFDKKTQNFLMITSLLDKVDPQLAVEITGIGDSADILYRLERYHYFTTMNDQSYYYHDLFKEFLRLQVAQSFSSKEIIEIKKRAAEYFESRGENESAIELYLDCDQPEKGSMIIERVAPMLITQGRYNSVQQWIARLPEKYQNSAELLYWHGIARMPFSPPEARGLLERSYTEYCKTENITGIVNSWASVVDTFLYEFGDLSDLDRSISEAEKIISQYPEFPAQQIEARLAMSLVFALTWRQPYHPELPIWAEKAKNIILGAIDLPQHRIRVNTLLFYYIYVGDLAKADFLMEALRQYSDNLKYDPLIKLIWSTVNVIYYWVKGEHSKCVETAVEALKYSQETGIVIHNLTILGYVVYSGLTLGDLQTAQHFLNQMGAAKRHRPVDNALYLHLESAIAWYRGDYSKALEYGKLALEVKAVKECPHIHAACLIDMAVNLFDSGSTEEAIAYLEKGGEVSASINLLRFHYLIQSARFAFHLKKEESGLDYLRQAFTLGSQQGYTNIHRWNNETMAILCSIALENEIEVEYAGMLIRKRGLLPPENRLTPQNWPKPVRIITLGKFELYLNGEQYLPKGKSPRMPLTLLKVLIVLGGENVSQAEIVDLLWPDSEGDHANWSLKTTCKRLRNILGSEEAIIVSEGAFSINRNYCYVDRFDMEEIIEQIEYVIQSDDPVEHAKGVALLNRAFDMYNGPFLPNDYFGASLESERSRLQQKIGRVVLNAVQLLSEQGESEKALKLLENGHLCDPMSEEIVRRLMLAYRGVGLFTEAVRIYLSWENNLSVHHGVTPSPQTKDIYNSLLNA